MKKITAFVFIAAFCFCLLPGASALAEEQTYNLKLQTLHPPSLMGYMETFAKDVETASNGRIKVQVFAGGELVFGSMPDSRKLADLRRDARVTWGDLTPAATATAAAVADGG